MYRDLHGEKSVRVHTRLPEDLHQALRDYAYTNRMMVSEALEKLLRPILDPMKDALLHAPDDRLRRDE